MIDIKFMDLIYLFVIVLLLFLVLFTNSNCQSLVDDRDQVWFDVMAKCDCACPNLDLWTYNISNVSVVDVVNVTVTYKS